MKHKIFFQIRISSLLMVNYQRALYLQLAHALTSGGRPYSPPKPNSQFHVELRFGNRLQGRMLELHHLFQCNKLCTDITSAQSPHPSGPHPVLIHKNEKKIYTRTIKFPDTSNFTRVRNTVMCILTVFRLMKYLKHVTVVL